MQELADFLGVSLSAISKIEKGYRRIDQEQLVRIAEFLDCPLQDIFVNEHNSQPEVVQAWRREQDRRNRVNERSGLKTLGAGLRQIRGQKNLTLAEVAENAKMTLSVYHRIEMGQREVSDEEFNNIAESLSLDKEDLRNKIKDLDKAGALEELIQRNDSRYRPISGPRGVLADFAAAAASKMPSHREPPSIPLYGTPGDNGDILVDKSISLGDKKCPYELMGKNDAYALNLCTRRLGNQLPTRSILYVDPSQMVSLGDIGLYFYEKGKAKIVSVRENSKGELYGLQWHPDEKVELPEAELSNVHKVVMISVG